MGVWGRERKPPSPAAANCCGSGALAANLLPQAGLNPDVAEVIEGDYQVVKKQAESDKPNGGIVKTKLKSVLELLTSSGNAAGAVEKILSIGTKAAQVAGLLFPFIHSDDDKYLHDFKDYMP